MGIESSNRFQQALCKEVKAGVVCLDGQDAESGCADTSGGVRVPECLAEGTRNVCEHVRFRGSRVGPLAISATTSVALMCPRCAILSCWLAMAEKPEALYKSVNSSLSTVCPADSSSSPCDVNCRLIPKMAGLPPHVVRTTLLRSAASALAALREPVMS